ncbi:MAG: hypothetical protein K8S27_08385 [Candidatus Omnitrophica bacterium]|nr:hypothetical protein [Candidatus Omnitrophota bacterium]
MIKKKIYDKDINFSNYGSFKKTILSKDGISITFIFTCNDNYVVKISSLKKWFKSPHYILQEGKLINFNRRLHVVKDAKKIIKIRCILLRTAIRIYFDNNAVNDVCWDTVLMACEPRYEHYGGFKKK